MKTKTLNKKNFHVYKKHSNLNNLNYFKRFQNYRQNDSRHKTEFFFILNQIDIVLYDVMFQIVIDTIYIFIKIQKILFN